MAKKKVETPFSQQEIEAGFFDVDATLRRDNLTLRVVQYLLAKKKIEPHHCKDLEIIITKWQERLAPYDEVTNELTRAIEHGLEGLHLDDLLEAGQQALAADGDRPYDFTRALLQSLKESKKPTFLAAISGSPMAIVDPYCRSLGFTEVHATLFDLDDGRVTGGFGKAVSPYHSKDQTCLKIAKKHKLTVEHGTIMGAMAIGDAVADHKMLSVVQYPIAFNPTRGLVELCRRDGIPIVIERKNMISIMVTPWAKAGSAMQEVQVEDILPKPLAQRMREKLPHLFAA